MKKIFRKIIFKLIIIVCLLGLVGFFMPGLFWTKKLGVSYTEKDLNKIKEFENFFEGKSNEVDAKLTSAELTAYLNSVVDKKEFKHVEAKIGDGFIELSTKVSKDFILKTILEDEVDEEAEKFIKLIPKNVNAYISITGGIKDNEPNVKDIKLNIQGIPVPKKLLDTTTITKEINSMLVEALSEDDAYVNKLTFKKDELVFKASQNLQ